MVFVFEVENVSDVSIILVVEPWADELEVPPRRRGRLRLLDVGAPLECVREVQMDISGRTVFHVWPGCFYEFDIVF